MSPKGKPKAPRYQGGSLVAAPDPPPDFDAMHPLFSFEKIVRWECDEKDKSQLWERIRRNGQQRWRDIREHGHKTLGFEPIPIDQFPPAVRRAATAVRT